jgi:UDP-glucose 4-epimerase
MMVIGGAGFIGSHVVDALLAEDVAEVVVFGPSQAGGHLADAPQLSKLKIVNGTTSDFDLVYHTLEGIDGVFLYSSLWMGECAEDPGAALNVNVVGAFNVLQACRQAGVARVVYASSSAVYGDSVESPITEQHPLNSRTVYGATKVAAEQFCRAYYATYGLRYVSCRYTNVYGPRQAFKGKHASVVLRFLERIIGGEPPIIFGDGTQNFDFLSVKDAARAAVLAMKADAVDECLNIGFGASASLNELVDLLLRLTGSGLKPEYQPQGTLNAPRQIFGVEKARALLGFQAETSLEDGLRALIHWRMSLH